MALAAFETTILTSLFIKVLSIFPSRSTMFLIAMWHPNAFVRSKIADQSVSWNEPNLHTALPSGARLRLSNSWWNGAPTTQVQIWRPGRVESLLC